MSFGLFIFCAVLVTFPLAFAVVSIIAGKVKLRRAMRPIEFYPPRGFSPIDVLIAYYGHRADARELFNPMMLYWADKGFIKVEEDCKRGLKITRLKSIEPPTDDDSTQSYADFSIQKTLFDKMFTYGSVFYTLAAPSAHMTAYEEFVSECKAAARKTRTRNSVKADHALSVVSVITLIITTIAVGLGGNHDTPAMIAMMIFPIVAVMALRLSEGMNSAFEKIIRYPFFGVWGGVPLGVCLSFLSLDCALILGYAVAASAVTVNILSKRIDLRSDRSIEIYGRISAFKTFLLEAEVDRLDALIEDDPNYFFNILPYCYVLKITKKLKPKFDRINLDGPSRSLGELRDVLMF